LGESYKKLYEAIHKKKVKTKLPSREVYLKGPGMILKGNPKNYPGKFAFKSLIFRDKPDFYQFILKKKSGYLTEIQILIEE
jgi:hypothetical protein